MQDTTGMNVSRKFPLTPHITKALTLIRLFARSLEKLGVTVLTQRTVIGVDGEGVTIAVHDGDVPLPAQERGQRGQPGAQAHVPAGVAEMDPDLLMEIYPTWQARGLLSGSLMDVEDLIGVVDSVVRFGASAAIPSITVTPRIPKEG